jgi:aminoglycoside phosphotransferase (APT) family kinase protein
VTSALPGLELGSLSRYLDEQHPGLAEGELRAELIAGGRSNLTYRLDDDRHQWVLRRPPLGHVLATAHDMSREYRVISALGPTPVPVPEAVLLCQDPEVLGAPFYLMQRVTGAIYRRPGQLAALGPERTEQVGTNLVDTLCALHSVDPAQVGLADFGRPAGFLARQLRRWSGQLEASTSRELAGMARLQQALAGDTPTSADATVLHGDYRLDNVLIGEDDRVAAVLDWEMSTLGDPLTDVALMVVYRQREVGGDDGPVANAATAEGFPDADQLVARYAEVTGRDVSRLGWYVAFAYFKLAVILEGIHYRFQQGQTVGDGFERVGDLVGPLIRAGLAAAGTAGSSERADTAGRSGTSRRAGQ